MVDMASNKSKTNLINLIYFIYMYKEDFALNNQQLLIYLKTELNQIIYI